MDKKDTPEYIWILMARKLSGEATEAELEELAVLLRENPQVSYSKEIMQDIWNSKFVPDRQHAENKYKELVRQMQDMGIDKVSFSGEEHFINSEVEEKKSLSGKRIKYALSMIALVVITGAVFLFLNKSESESATAALEQPVKNEVSTKNGSKSSLVLPDGTKVWLNAGSKLTYDKTFGNKIREVQLSGEGYFDVAHNAAKPFIIHTTAIDIKVLGTQFNVKCYPGEKATETSLIKGSIEVTLKDRHEKIMMKPNEKLVINNEDALAVKPVKLLSQKGDVVKVEKPIISLSHITFLPTDSTVIETAWVKNRLAFSSETFEEVALKMEHWYNTTIEFADERLKAQRLTGNFEKENIIEALNALQLTTHFLYTTKNDKITIYR